jgi:hypothetical protein
MRGNGHHYVRLARFAMGIKNLAQAGGEPGSQGSYLVVLEEHDRGRHGFSIRSIAAGEIKVVQAAAADVTQRKVLNIKGKSRNKWPPAASAAWTFKGLEQSQASAAYGDSAGGIQQLPAKFAGCRKNYRSKSFAQFPEASANRLQTTLTRGLG